MVEGARLESVYTSKAYRGFESHPLRQSLIHEELLASASFLDLCGFTFRSHSSVLIVFRMQPCNYVGQSVGQESSVGQQPVKGGQEVLWAS